MIVMTCLGDLIASLTLGLAVTLSEIRYDENGHVVIFRFSKIE